MSGRLVFVLYIACMLLLATASTATGEFTSSDVQAVGSLNNVDMEFLNKLDQTKAAPSDLISLIEEEDDVTKSSEDLDATAEPNADGSAKEIKSNSDKLQKMIDEKAQSLAEDKDILAREKLLRERAAEERKKEFEAKKAQLLKESANKPSDFVKKNWAKLRAKHLKNKRMMLGRQKKTIKSSENAATRRKELKRLRREQAKARRIAWLKARKGRKGRKSKKSKTTSKKVTQTTHISKSEQFERDLLKNSVRSRKLSTIKEINIMYHKKLPSRRRTLQQLSKSMRQKALDRAEEIDVAIADTSDNYDAVTDVEKKAIKSALKQHLKHIKKLRDLSVTAADWSVKVGDLVASKNWNLTPMRVFDIVGKWDALLGKSLKIVKKLRQCETRMNDAKDLSAEYFLAQTILANVKNDHQDYRKGNQAVAKNKTGVSAFGEKALKRAQAKYDAAQKNFFQSESKLKVCHRNTKKSLQAQIEALEKFWKWLTGLNATNGVLRPVNLHMDLELNVENTLKDIPNFMIAFKSDITSVLSIDSARIKVSDVYQHGDYVRVSFTITDVADKQTELSAVSAEKALENAMKNKDPDTDILSSRPLLRRLVRADPLPIMNIGPDIRSESWIHKPQFYESATFKADAAPALQRAIVVLP